MRSTWLAVVSCTKDGHCCISAPTAAVSRIAPGRASPWQSLPEAPPTSRSAARTGSRTTSAPRTSSAHPAEDRGSIRDNEGGVAREDMWRYGGCQQGTRWGKTQLETRRRERKEKVRGKRWKRDTETGGGSVHAGSSSWSSHLQLCTWVSSPRWDFRQL